jgi:tetratricopeptide (TPR) repeat protein
MTGRIGPYRLLEEIGRGGMGVVYRAERDDEVRRRVAIKVMRPFADDRAAWRFAEERRILASMQHPGIVRLVDGGTTADGSSYTAMELVDGMPIDRYCNTHGLSLRERLAMFVRVCEAIAYAHRRLVVHGDLKPPNILVTGAGTPVVLDFGVARLLEAEPHETYVEEAPALTVQYASPERLRGTALTTAVDVYSLGVLLYELLTGRTPHLPEGRSRGQLVHVICTEEPIQPSEAVSELERKRELRGDLDAIVLMALRKEAHHRYGSVEQVADDLRRFLDGQPVIARAATWTYVAARFARRHLALAATIAGLAVMLASFVLALAWAAAVARYDRDVAERVTSMLIQVFSGSAPRTPSGDELSARELLDLGAEGIRRNLDIQPDLQAYVAETFGSMSAGLLRGESATTNEASATMGTAGAADSLPAAFALERLAMSLAARGQLAVAEPLARQAFDMTRRLIGIGDPQTAQRLISLASIVYERGRQDEAERMLVQAAAVFRDSLGPEHPMVALALHNLAMSRRDRGDFDGAERLLREALAIRRRSLAQTQWDNVSILADVAERQGRPEEAKRLLRQVVDALRVADDPNLAQALARLADPLSHP